MSLAQPRGLFYLAFTEAWERFSYYGMTSLLALYMVDRLLLAGHAEHVAGLAAFRGSLEVLTGPLSIQALASLIFGLYTGFVYFTPLLGGIVADRWIGHRAAVVIGALAMSAGHIAMTFDRTFLVALALLVIGSGFLKGNISTQVGALYRPEDTARRTHGFIIFSTAINIGAIVGPLVCGLLAQQFGWHYGFGVAALLMLIGLATYLRGYRHLPARAGRLSQQSGQLTTRDRQVILALVVIIGISIFQSIAYYQLYNVMPLWIQQHVAPDVFGFRIPIPWYQSVSALASIAGVPLLFWIWRQQAARKGEPGELAKMGTGAWLAAASNLVLVVAIAWSRGDERVNPLWPFLSSVGFGIAFLYYWPTLLALVSRAAPAPISATLIGLALMSLFVANTSIGWIGGFYETMRPEQFWLLHAAIAGVGGILVIVLGPWLSRRLDSPPLPPEAGAIEGSSARA